jgi:hypothetical protein
MADDDALIEYRLLLRNPDGESPGGMFRTRRARNLGDLVNLPTGPDGSSEAGKGHTWRVVATGDEPPTLTLQPE